MQKAKKNYHGYLWSLGLMTLGALLDVGLAAGTISKGPKVASFVGTLAGLIVLVCTSQHSHVACIHSSMH